MKMLIGGAVSAVLGLIGISIWFREFLQIMAGTLPIMLLLGGSLTLYLGFDELKDQWKSESDISEDNESNTKETVTCSQNKKA